MAGKEGGLRCKKSSGRARPAGDVPYIPMEVWTEILIRTPAEDLVKLKGVCRAWCELISRRSFAESHADHWTSRPVGRFLLNVHDLPVEGENWWHDIFYLSNVNHRESEPGSGRLLKEKDGNYTCSCRNLLTSRQRAELGCGTKGLNVLASCDGLILILIWYEELFDYQLLICNPVTGSYKKLPVFPRAYCHVGCMFSLYKWTMLRTASGQYKVFGIAKVGEFPASMGRECYILELQIGTKGQPERQWKKLTVPLSSEWSIRDSATKDGKLHWLATEKQGLRHSYNCNTKLVSIDVLKEEFSVSVSVEPAVREWGCCFFAWKGAFYGFYHRRHDTFSSLWVMEDFDTMNWTEYGNFRYSYGPDSIFVSGEGASVIGDNMLFVEEFYPGDIYVFDLILKKFGRLEFCTIVPPGRIALHINSLIGCN